MADIIDISKQWRIIHDMPVIWVAWFTIGQRFLFLNKAYITCGLEMFKKMLRAQRAWPFRLQH